MSIDGSMEVVGTSVHEVRDVLHKYPAAAKNTGVFFYATLQERFPWVSQLPEERQADLRAWHHDIESLRRRRQERRQD